MGVYDSKYLLYFWSQMGVTLGSSDDLGWVYLHVWWLVVSWPGLGYLNSAMCVSHSPLGIHGQAWAQSYQSEGRGRLRASTIAQFLFKPLFVSCLLTFLLI